MAKGRGLQAASLALVAYALAATAAIGPTVAAASGEGILFVRFSAGEVCSSGQFWADEGSILATMAADACVAKVTSVGGVLAAAYTLHDLINASLPQPPDFFGFFREATVATTFLVPAAPPPGSQVQVALLLNHLIVLLWFDADGIAVVPVGDPILHIIPPAPPPFFAGAVLGKVQYRTPFQVTVDMNTYGHRIVVQQNGATVAAATLKKIFAHPDRLTDAGVFLAEGELREFAIWSMGPVQFRGVKSPAEVTIVSAASSSQEIRIVSIERRDGTVRM